MRLRRRLRKKVRTLLRRFGFRKSRAFDLGYVPEPGRRSEKAERLVDYCLGGWSDRPVQPCTKNPEYLNLGRVFLMEAARRRLVVSVRAMDSTYDQKNVAKALISQLAAIPPGFASWVARGDRAGRTFAPEEGLHITGMRYATRRDLVLVPTAGRERHTGPRLRDQMNEMRKEWVPWEEKSDSAWWGGAITGDRWLQDDPRPLTRREVLCYFRDHPSDRVQLHPTETSGRIEAPEGIELQADFEKRSAFSHKCLLLLPGNDIASGSSWYFAGNSVVMMPRPHLEHILYFEMEPWEHYVPLENDPADILVKLRWVLDHEEEAQRIVANSHERLRWLFSPAYLWGCNEVLRRISGPQSRPSGAEWRREDPTRSPTGSARL